MTSSAPEKVQRLVRSAPLERDGSRVVIDLIIAGSEVPGRVENSTLSSTSRRWSWQHHITSHHMLPDGPWCTAERGQMTSMQSMALVRWTAGAFHAGDNHGPQPTQCSVQCAVCTTIQKSLLLMFCLPFYRNPPLATESESDRLPRQLNPSPFGGPQSPLPLPISCPDATLPFKRFTANSTLC